MSRWDFARLKRQQEHLAGQVILVDHLPKDHIRTVAGADLTFLNPWKTPTPGSHRDSARRPRSGAKGATLGMACMVLMSYPELEPLDCVVVQGRVTFPYVPSFLAYRELPLLLKAYRKIRGRADVYLIDGQGVAHPRRFGIAAHFGVTTGEMTIGCAKSRLCGDYRVPKQAGRSTTLRDGRRNELGRVFRPGRGKSLLFVSPGYLVSANTSLRIVKSCLKGHKIPEPIRLAHNHLREVRRSLL